MKLYYVSADSYDYSDIWLYAANATTQARRREERSEDWRESMEEKMNHLNS